MNDPALRRCLLETAHRLVVACSWLDETLFRRTSCEGDEDD